MEPWEFFLNLLNSKSIYRETYKHTWDRGPRKREKRTETDRWTKTKRRVR